MILSVFFKVDLGKCILTERENIGILMMLELGICININIWRHKYYIGLDGRAGA